MQLEPALLASIEEDVDRRLSTAQIVARYDVMPSIVNAVRAALRRIDLDDDRMPYDTSASPIICRDCPTRARVYPDRKDGTRCHFHAEEARVRARAARRRLGGAASLSSQVLSATS